LQGARLVTSVETEEGRAWAESKIKTLTGGDPIAARFMRQDFFEYSPQFKLFIAGNHRPALRSVDEAIRRRFHLVPFTVTIPPEERDGTLTEQLKAEWPGILAWMIGGCLQWQRHGLNPPKAVLAATAEYLEGEDALLAWIDEDCERDPQAHAKTSDLYESFRRWADRNGEHAGSAKRFAQSLETHGFRKTRTRAARGFIGLSVKSSEHGMASGTEAKTGPAEKATADSMWA
jgi:putative DNA primase/helicase